MTFLIRLLLSIATALLLSTASRSLDFVNFSTYVETEFSRARLADGGPVVSADGRIAHLSYASANNASSLCVLSSAGVVQWETKLSYSQATLSFGQDYIAVSAGGGTSPQLSVYRASNGQKLFQVALDEGHSQTKVLVMDFDSQDRLNIILERHDPNLFLGNRLTRFSPELPVPIFQQDLPANIRLGVTSLTDAGSFIGFSQEVNSSFVCFFSPEGEILGRSGAYSMSYEASFVTSRQGVAYALLFGGSVSSLLKFEPTGQITINRNFVENFRDPKLRIQPDGLYVLSRMDGVENALKFSSTEGHIVWRRSFDAGPGVSFTPAMFAVPETGPVTILSNLSTPEWYFQYIDRNSGEVRAPVFTPFSSTKAQLRKFNISPDQTNILASSKVTDDDYVCEIDSLSANGTTQWSTRVDPTFPTGLSARAIGVFLDGSVLTESGGGIRRVIGDQLVWSFEVPGAGVSARIMSEDIVAVWRQAGFSDSEQFVKLVNARTGELIASRGFGNYLILDVKAMPNSQYCVVAHQTQVEVRKLNSVLSDVWMYRPPIVDQNFKAWVNPFSGNVLVAHSSTTAELNGDSGTPNWTRSYILVLAAVLPLENGNWVFARGANTTTDDFGLIVSVTGNTAWRVTSAGMTTGRFTPSAIHIQNGRVFAVGARGTSHLYSVARDLSTGAFIWQQYVTYANQFPTVLDSFMDQNGSLCAVYSRYRSFVDKSVSLCEFEPLTGNILSNFALLQLYSTAESAVSNRTRLAVAGSVPAEPGGSSATVWFFAPARQLTIQSFQVVEGEHLSGDLQSVQASDGNVFTALPDSYTSRTSFLAHAVDDRSAVIRWARLKLSYLVERRGLGTIVKVFDFGSGAWVVQSEGASLSLELHPLLFSGIDFSNSDMATQIRLEFLPLNDEDPSQDGWGTVIDELKLELASW